MNAKLKFGLLLGLLLWANFQIRLNAHGRSIPPRQSFDRFPLRLAGWSGRDLPSLSEEEKQVLKADDYLLRSYDRDGTSITVFIAYYRSQHSGDALHSPKNCLPGAGWSPLTSQVMRIPSPARAGQPFEVNHYLIQKSGKQAIVLYWYQANQRVFASEYWGKVYLVWDAITKNRTDGALIRLSLMRSPESDQALHETADFAQVLSAVLPEFIQN